jgi:hypothetical protein
LSNSAMRMPVLGRRSGRWSASRKRHLGVSGSRSGLSADRASTRTHLGGAAAPRPPSQPAMIVFALSECLLRRHCRRSSMTSPHRRPPARYNGLGIDRLPSRSRWRRPPAGPPLAHRQPRPR